MSDPIERTLHAAKCLWNAEVMHAAFLERFSSQSTSPAETLRRDAAMTGAVIIHPALLSKGYPGTDGSQVSALAFALAHNLGSLAAHVESSVVATALKQRAKLQRAAGEISSSSSGVVFDHSQLPLRHVFYSCATGEHFFVSPQSSQFNAAIAAIADNTPLKEVNAIGGFESAPVGSPPLDARTNHPRPRL